MEQQLNRIRSKDYSLLDNKLLDGALKVNNMAETMSHLSQLQRFLIEQINEIDRRKAKEETETKLKQASTKVLTSRSGQKQHLKSVSDKMRMLQEQLGKLGVDLVNNLEDLLASTSDGVDRIVAKLASENHCLRRELQAKNAQIQELQADNTRLRDTCQEWEQAKAIRQSKGNLFVRCLAPFTYENSCKYNSDKILDISPLLTEKGEQKLHKHQSEQLKERPSQQQIAPFEKQQGQPMNSPKLVEPVVHRMLRENSLARNHGVRRQKSNHSMSTKDKCSIRQQLQEQKENTMILAKGADLIQKKCQQKIKVFSGI